MHSVNCLTHHQEAPQSSKSPPNASHNSHSTACASVHRVVMGRLSSENLVRKDLRCREKSAPVRIRVDAAVARDTRNRALASFLGRACGARVERASSKFLLYLNRFVSSSLLTILTDTIFRTCSSLRHYPLAIEQLHPTKVH